MFLIIYLYFCKSIVLFTLVVKLICSKLSKGSVKSIFVFIFYISFYVLWSNSALPWLYNLCDIFPWLLCTWFEHVSMLVILLNCVTLGMFQPCEDLKCQSEWCVVLQVRLAPLCNERKLVMWWCFFKPHSKIQYSRKAFGHLKLEYICIALNNIKPSKAARAFLGTYFSSLMHYFKTN